MIPPSRLRTNLAAAQAYEGSSLHIGPWEALPASRKLAYRKQAAHLITPKAHRQSAVAIVVSQAVWDRRKESAA